MFSSILIGLSLGLYFHIRQPARFFLAAVAILYHPPDLNPKSTWFIPVLLLGVPIFDTTLVTFSRLKRGKPLFNADRSHTYHRLVDFGFSPGFSVLIIQVSALLLSFAAFIIMYLPPSWAFTFFILTLLAAAILIVFFERKFYENRND